MLFQAFTRGGSRGTLGESKKKSQARRDCDYAGTSDLGLGDQTENPLSGLVPVVVPVALLGTVPLFLDMGCS